MFLDSTYFHGELSLPNLKYSGPAVGIAKAILTVTENNLDWFIAKYEPLFLKDLLGEELMKNFLGGLNQAEINPIWSDLKDEIYKRVDGFGFSPAANYVYFFTKRDGRTKGNMNGEVIPTQDYAEIAQDANKLVKAWNDMLPEVHTIRKYIFDNWNAYKDYAGSRGCVCRCNFAPINTFNL